MFRKLVIASALIFSTAAFAQQNSQPANMQIVVQELAKRQAEEMNKAILCEVGKDDLMKQIASLKAEVEKLKKPAEKPAPDPVK